MNRTIYAISMIFWTLFMSAQNVSVHHTLLKVDVRDFNSHVLSGKATLDVKSEGDGVNSVNLKLLHMSIDSVWVAGVECFPKCLSALVPQTMRLTYNDTILSVPLSRPMMKGDSVTVTISYHGTPHAEVFGGFGFYDADRMAHNMGVSFDDRPHTYGKSWRPCLDEFTERSTFDCYYQTDTDRMAVANGLLMGCDTVTHSIVNNHRVQKSLVWHWTMNTPLPDYLVNVAVGDYRKVHYEYDNGRGIPIDAYVLPDEVEGAREAYAWVPKVLRVMESHFGPYAWDRVGYVSVNSPHGAMEHATNISMPRHPDGSELYVEFLTHELIHHWFGDLVTCKTEGDMWLNEGITSYMVEVVGEEIFTKEHLENYRKYLDSWQTRCPVGSKNYHPLANMPSEYTYGTIVYLKGGWVMRQLRHELGDKKFFKAMHDYVRHYAFRNVTTEDFKAFMEKSSGRNLTRFFDKYIYK